MITLITAFQDLTSDITATTGTIGNTLITDGNSDSTISGVGIIALGIIVLLFIIAHLLDRKYSHPLYEELKLKEEEDQEVQTEYTKDQ